MFTKIMQIARCKMQNLTRRVQGVVAVRFIAHIGRVQGFKDSRLISGHSTLRIPYLLPTIYYLLLCLYRRIVMRPLLCLCASVPTFFSLLLPLLLTLTLWLAGCGGGGGGSTPAPTTGTVSGQAVVPAQNMASLPSSTLEKLLNKLFHNKEAYAAACSAATIPAGYFALANADVTISGVSGKTGTNGCYTVVNIPTGNNQIIIITKTNAAGKTTVLEAVVNVTAGASTEKTVNDITTAAAEVFKAGSTFSIAQIETQVAADPEILKKVKECATASSNTSDCLSKNVKPTKKIITFTSSIPTTITSSTLTIEGNIKTDETKFATDTKVIFLLNNELSYVNLTNETFSKTVSLTPGSNTIQVKSLDGYFESDEKTVVYTPDTTAPTTTATPAGGAYTSAQTVTLTANETASIYYTTDGTSPTTNSTRYIAPITISTITTLKFFAKDAAGNSESVKTETYTINIPSADTTAPTTTATPAGGAYTSAQTVTLTANETASIYYTTDGTTPTTNSTRYTTPITISTTTPLKFFAKDTAGNSESVKTETYIITESCPSTEVCVKVGDVTGTHGSEVTVPISISNVSRIESAAINLNYDSTKLSITADATTPTQAAATSVLAAGNAQGSTITGGIARPGLLKIGIISASGFAGDGTTVVNVKFNVLSGVSGVIPITYSQTATPANSVGGRDGEAVPVTKWAGGTITVR